jgi:hypothetical protein
MLGIQACLLRTVFICLAVALLNSTRWRRGYTTPSSSAHPNTSSNGSSTSRCCLGDFCRGTIPAHVAEHYQPKKKTATRPGQAQEEAMELAVLIAALLSLTAVLIKVSFLACFADEVPEGVRWRWAAAAEAVVFVVVEYLLLRRFRFVVAEQLAAAAADATDEYTCVLILLYMCAAIHVFSYYCISAPSYYSVSSHHYTCVLILLYMCPVTMCPVICSDEAVFYISASS